MFAVFVRLLYGLQDSEVVRFEQRRQDLWPMASANFSKLLAGRKHAAQRMETFALSSLDSYLLSASNVVPILTRTATFPMYSSIFCIVPKVWTFKLQP
jgi:hypothetical protein